MVLSNLSQMFVIYFSPNYFYPEVVDRWLPIIRRQTLPYVNLEDYMNAQIQSIDFPALSMQVVEQQMQNYKLVKRAGKQTDMLMDKNLTITMKLTESYTSYFIMRQQMDLYYKMIHTKGLYWSPIMIDLLDDQGHAIITYEEEQITPESISELPLSYAARLGSYNTFTLGVRYNFFNIWYLDAASGKMKKEYEYV